MLQFRQALSVSRQAARTLRTNLECTRCRHACQALLCVVSGCDAEPEVPNVAVFARALEAAAGVSGATSWMPSARDSASSASKL